MTGLKKNQEFSEVYHKGISKADGNMVLYCRNRGDSGESRFGISVSKKVGNSVVRHRVKRRIREICRLNETELPKGCDFVVIARRKAAEAPYGDLEKSFMRLVGHLC